MSRNVNETEVLLTEQLKNGVRESAAKLASTLVEYLLTKEIYAGIKKDIQELNTVCQEKRENDWLVIGVLVQVFVRDIFYACAYTPGAEGIPNEIRDKVREVMREVEDEMRKMAQMLDALPYDAKGLADMETREQKLQEERNRSFLANQRIAETYRYRDSIPESHWGRRLTGS